MTRDEGANCRFPYYFVGIIISFEKNEIIGKFENETKTKRKRNLVR